jgi:hypothetical protein
MHRMGDLVGNMRKVCALCLNIPTSQGAGYTDNYGILLTTRGKLEKSSGSRGLISGEIEGNSSYNLTVRYQQAIDVNLSVSSKWLIDGIFYTIDSWEKVDQINFYYKFRLSKKEPPVSALGGLSDIEILGLQPGLILTTTPGATSVDMGVAPSEIILVARTGQIYTRTVGAPGNFQFAETAGVISFNIAFNAGEIVYVLYKLSA